MIETRWRAAERRLVYIRTWRYVAQRKGRIDDESHWRGETRAVRSAAEDRLSDALHARLTQRFVGQRTSVLLRRLKQKESLVAEANDKGEVTVEGQFVGRLEGFRFRQDAPLSPDEAKTLRTASLQALALEFHLRADRFYNAPDTGIDYTDQGGMMWGELAVGKLVAGAEPLKPQVEAFVDDEAGPDVAQKVQRRLQHFVDRKIAVLFEPLLNLQRDEALTGLARGFAFRLVEALGVLPRQAVASEVKELDQDARGALRKHGIRFGQYTIFLPLLLKPAPTRLRLLLWSLSQNLDEFPESPPPGLVTIPTMAGAPEVFHTMAGYHAAGERAIRIDMLERLADLLRAENSRAGFEARADMLSITGMTLDQFADLMQGLGYAAEKGERAKVKATPVVRPKPVGTSEVDVQPDADRSPEPQSDVHGYSGAEAGGAPEPDGTPAEASGVDALAGGVSGVEAHWDADGFPKEHPGADGNPEADTMPSDMVEPFAGTPEDAGLETEIFYTFTWGGFARNRATPRGKGRPQGKADGKPRTQGKRPPKGAPGQTGFKARPPRKEKAIDPDNPFAAALMGLRDKT